MTKRTGHEHCDVILLRHAHSTANLKGILAGRDNQIGLSDRGKNEAVDISNHLSEFKFDAIYSSPLKRCSETLAPWVEKTNTQIEYLPDLIEMEYGDWAGLPLAKLSKKPLWDRVQSRPSTVRFPDGESFLEMSTRANQAILDVARGKSRVLVVSHGDVIKAIVAFHLGMALDSFQRIAIDPGSITTIRVPNSHVIQVNSTAHLVTKSPNPKGKRDRFSLGGGQGQL